MPRRGGQFTDFLTNFASGYDLGRKLSMDKAMQDAANLQPQQTTIAPTLGTTALDPSQLAGAQSVGPAVDIDHTSPAGIVADMQSEVPSTTVAPQATMFTLGDQTQATPFSPAQVASARSNAQVQALSQFNPAAATRLQANQLTLQNAEDAKAKQDDIDNIYAQHTKALGDSPTYGDIMGSMVGTASDLMGNGHAKEGLALMQQTQTMALNKVKADSVQRGQAVGPAVGAAMQGNYTPAVQYMNEYLGYGNTVTGIKPDGNGNVVISSNDHDGKPQQDVTVPTGQFTQALAASASNQGALSVINMQARAKYQGLAAQRQTAEGNARVAMLLQQNPQATDAEKQAAFYGVTPDTTKEPALVQIAKAGLNAGIAKDMKGALIWARTSSSLSPQTMFANTISSMARNSMAPSDPNVLAANALKVVQVAFPGWAPGSSASGAPPSAVAGSGAAANAAAGAGPSDLVQPSGRGDGRYITPDPAKLKQAQGLADDASIAATAKKYGITRAEVRRRLGMPPG